MGLDLRPGLEACSDRSRADRCKPLVLAILAALGFVLELFVVEEKLFARGEHEIGTAVNALQHPVLEFHPRLLWPSANGTSTHGLASLHCMISPLSEQPPWVRPLRTGKCAGYY